MPKATISDDYELNDDGTATFEFDGITRVLKRPTLRQYRTAVEALGGRKDTLLGATKDGDIESVGVGVQLDALVEWFDVVFTDLAGEGLPKTADGEIDEDRLPSWLLSGTIVQGLVGHWQAVPSHRGGR